VNSPAAVLAGRAQWCVIRGDSRAVLPHLRDRSVDHVITDPPYRRALYEGFRTNSFIRSTDRTASGKRVPSTNYMALASQKIGALEDVIGVTPDLTRLTSRWLVVFHDAESGHIWREQLGAHYVRAGVWVKTNPVPQISGDRPGQGFEAVTIGHSPGRMRWNGGGKAAVWRHTAVQGNRIERRGNPHPCPKPLSLMLELVQLFTDPDDLVLDPFCRLGSTGVACVRARPALHRRRARRAVRGRRASATA
jgi:hypothetical protein